MPRFIKKTSKKMGLPPGALVHIGEKRLEETSISIIDYDQAQFQEKEVEKIEKQIKNAPADKHEELKDQLRKAKAERNRMRNILEGKKG